MCLYVTWDLVNMQILFQLVCLKGWNLTFLGIWQACCCSVTKSCPALWDPIGHSTLSFPVLHYLSICSNSCPLIQWCSPTTSSPVIPFPSYLQSFPASGSFPMSGLFASGGQSIGASASASVLPMNIQGWFPLGLTGWSPWCSRDSQESSPTPQFKSMKHLTS